MAWLSKLLGTTPPGPATPGQDAKQHLEELAALPAHGRIAEAARRAMLPGTDLVGLAAALMPFEHQAVLDQVDGQTQIRCVEAGFEQHSTGGRDGMTFVASNLVLAFKKSTIPDSIREFVDSHRFEGRIHAVRQGRPAFRSEEAPEVRRALEKLDRAQMKVMREVLVEKPPHPDLKAMKKHPALKGPVTVDGLMSILAGEPLGLDSDCVSPPIFKRIFTPGQPVSVRRGSGLVEPGWKIQAQSPSGEIVVANGNGLFKVVPPKDLLGLNPQLVPLETPLNVKRSNTNNIEGGWRASAHLPNGEIEARKPNYKRPTSIGNIIEANEAFVLPPRPQGLAARVFAKGQVVDVRRSTGALLEGWTIEGIIPGTSEVFVTKDRAWRRQPVEQLLVDNPHLIPVGLELSIPRSLGWVEDGWKSFGPTDDGRIRMVNPRGEWKAIPTEELIELNRDLLLSSEDTQFTLTGTEARARPGQGLEQAKRFQVLNRVEAGNVVHDGYVDGGRGMRFESDRVVAPREVMVVDRSRDAALRDMLAWARSIQGLPEDQRALALTRMVYDHFRPTDGNAEDAANRLQEQQKSREVLIGDASRLGGGGACRHRALLFKLLADEAGLQVALVRGYMKSGGRYGGHAWNELTFSNGDKRMVDVMNPTRHGRDFVLPLLDARALTSGYMDAAGAELYGAAR